MKNFFVITALIIAVLLCSCKKQITIETLEKKIQAMDSCKQENLAERYFKNALESGIP
ncbi:MAG: hypothetical protein JXB49_14625 [Bacteroidales bacterium]|nr:hypothetical protein [Bacteroidales bacterium]MBN2820495.1 hypothetical protein [Bacteroidales bacterium]